MEPKEKTEVSSRVPSSSPVTELCVSSILPFFPPEMACKRFGDCCDFDLIEERLDHATPLHGFSLNVLACAIQNALDPKCIERCLKTFNASVMKYSLKIPVLGGSIVSSLPILYFRRRAQFAKNHENPVQSRSRSKRHSATFGTTCVILCGLECRVWFF